MITQKRYDWFSLTFKNSLSGATREVHFAICEDPLSQKWAGLLQKLLSRNTYLRKDTLFYGWRSKTRNINFLCSELNRHIEKINKFYSHKHPDIRYHIPWIFAEGSVDQQLLNLIHHDFEVLTGPTWNLSKRYKMAPPDIRFSIQQLNSLCHEIESVLWAQRAQNSNQPHGAMIASIFPNDKLPISEEEKAHAQIIFNFGEVRLHYAQMGKTHYDSYLCNDSAIAPGSVTELRYLTGEFDINFGPDLNEDYKASVHRAFTDWLHQKGVRNNGPFGFPIVAKLDRSQFTSDNPMDIMSELSLYDDVSRVSISYGGTVSSRDFNYAASDSLSNNPQTFRWQHLFSPHRTLDALRARVFRAYYALPLLHRFFSSN